MRAGVARAGCSHLVESQAHRSLSLQNLDPLVLAPGSAFTEDYSEHATERPASPSKTRPLRGHELRQPSSHTRIDHVTGPRPVRPLGNVRRDAHDRPVVSPDQNDRRTLAARGRTKVLRFSSTPRRNRLIKCNRHLRGANREVVRALRRYAPARLPGKPYDARTRRRFLTRDRSGYRLADSDSPRLPHFTD